MKQIAQPKLTGRNIYIDKKNRCIYYNKRSKIGYVVTDDKTTKFKMLMNRYILGFIAVVFLVALFNIDYFISIGIGIGIVAVLEYQYRKKMLPSLTQLTTFVPEKRMSLIEEMSKQDSSKLMIQLILYIALGILIIVNGIQQNFEPLQLAFCGLISLGCLYFVVNIIRAMAFKKK